MAQSDPTSYTRTSISAHEARIPGAALLKRAQEYDEH